MRILNLLEFDFLRRENFRDEFKHRVNLLSFLNFFGYITK